MEVMTTAGKKDTVKFRIITVNGEKMVEMSNDGVVLVVAKKISVGNKVYAAPSASQV